MGQDQQKVTAILTPLHLNEKTQLYTAEQYDLPAIHLVCKTQTAQSSSQSSMRGWAAELLIHYECAADQPQDDECMRDTS